MKTILNVIWLVFAGIWLALGYVLAAILMAITIIGIPFAVLAHADSSSTAALTRDRPVARQSSSTN